MLHNIRHEVKKNEIKIRIDALLSQLLNESRSFIKENEQYIKIQSGPVKPSYKVKMGDIIEFNFYEKIETSPLLIPEDIPLDIVFEDNDILVINKPRGMVVHPAKGNWTGTLSNAIAFHLKINDPNDMRPGLVHRLDKDTSGLMVIAKNRSAQNNLVKQFKNREIIKIYTAIVAGYLNHSYGTIENYITRDHKNRLLFKVSANDEGRYAVSEYQVVKELHKATLVKIRIHTGRTHQIRVHFKHLGNILVGDLLYGSQFHRYPLCLHASKLIFNHPTSHQKMEFESHLPQELRNVEEMLKK